jgi:hypothetical protein
VQPITGWPVSFQIICIAEFSEWQLKSALCRLSSAIGIHRDATF